MNRRLLVLLMLGAGSLLVFGSTPSTASEYRLSLDDCLRRALENNYDLVRARIDPQISEQNVQFQDAQFDGGFSLTPQLSGYKREKRTQFETAGEGETYEFTAGLRQNFKYGGNYTASLNYSRETGSNVLFEPFYQSVLTARYQQPLRAGFGKEAAAETYLIAMGNLDISREELRRQTELTLETVEAGYWNVAAAREALRVARQARQRALDLLELNRKKVEVGTLAPIEITQAEAGVAGEEENVIVAETALEDAEDELLRLMAVNPDDPMWDQEIIIADQLDYSAVQIDLDQTMTTALENRPEMASVRQDLQNKELSERATRNRLRHGLDLDVLIQPFGNNNDGGTVVGNDVIFDEASPETAVSEIFKGENYFWQAGVTWSFPFGNRAAKANYRSAELNTHKAEIAITDQEQTIRVEVRSAVRGVDSGIKRVNAAQANVELQQKKLEAEQKKYENGMSTSFEVLTFQNDLANAELSHIRALVNYANALAKLERVKGTLLQSRGLALDVPDQAGS